jgi:NTE family protein
MASEASILSKVIQPISDLGRKVLSIPAASQQAGLKIGLALSGGFARGIAHIGVLKVLEEAKIPIAFIAGSSVGALIGAIYCAGATAREMEEIACRVRRRHFVRWKISRYGLFSSSQMMKFLDKILTVKRFEELQIPLAITATEISSGEGVFFRSGPLAEAVRASCAYPGVFPPVHSGGRLLVDGGLTHPEPTQPLLEMGAERIVAVRLRNSPGLGGPRNVIDVVAKCFAIRWRQGEDRVPSADLWVEPEVRRFRYDDFERAAELVRAGETVMRAALPNLFRWFEKTPHPEVAEAARAMYAQDPL